LVIDIGGGSTETIIGEKFTPIRMESLYMGCVNMSKRFFSDGHITKKILKKANIAAQQELESVAFEYKQTGWDQVVGSSGTIRAISSVMKVENMTDGNITWKAMKLLRKNLLNAGHIDNLQLNGLDHERRPVFAGGFVVLYALFKAFELDEMQISDGAVREGLIYDLLGRIKHEDIREITVQRLSERYSIQREHANSVAETALYLYMRVADNWDIKNKFNQKLLRWSALLHELGLTIAHAGYHKHGAYLALNSDLPGFSLQEQQFLATLIRAHRQKFPTQLFDTLSRDYVEPAIKLSILLRIAVILHRSRALNSTPKLQISTSPSKLKIKFPPDWFESHTLTYADLKNEADILKANGYTLKISD
jgi:exopolyphosphatase/guanosine-5'-triphosphate,3'-diphosphate pyrophosphatase